MSKKNLSDKQRKGFDPQTLRRLFSYMRKYRVKLIAVAICIILGSVASAASSLFLQKLIDNYITPMLKVPDPIFTGLLRALCIIGIICLIGAAATWIYNKLMVTIAQGTLKEIRDEMFEKMQRLPIRYFDTHTHGEIMSLYTNDTDTLRQLIAQSLSQLVASLCMIIAVFFCMIYLSIWLTVIVIVLTFFILRVAAHIAQKSGKWFISQQKTLADLNGYVEEMINGQKVIKVFCHEEAAKEKFRNVNNAWEKSSEMANSGANTMMPMLNALGYIQYIVIAVLGAYMAIASITNPTLTGVSTLTIGAVISFLTLSRSFTNQISQISNQFNSVVTALAGASRIFAFMDESPETDNGYVTLVNIKDDDEKITETEERTEKWAWKHPHGDGTITYTRVEGKVVLNHVDFSYEDGKPVLHDIELYAEPGQKIAFVGATGAGKTTIANLINRFYDIDDGKIRYDGININKIKKADLRRSLGVVLQEVNLFTGTIMENLRYGNPDATDAQCIAAAILANADGFIRMLPKGYDTEISGGGEELSQGQRQLISIARAAVSDPPVMIMDEATSSVDTRTEMLIQNGMDRLMKDRTVFVIAHRLSTVQNADVIMVLDHGRIIERGNHEKLISEKGTYYKLYTGAFELE